MQKLKQQKYRTLSGEIKVNCYKITIPKSLCKEVNFDESTILNIRADKDKIIIEKAK